MRLTIMSCYERFLYVNALMNVLLYSMHNDHIFT